MVQQGGGNPGAWFDSTAPYFSDHPNFTAVPPAGTPLQLALASGALVTASVDIERLDTSSASCEWHEYTRLASARRTRGVAINQNCP